MTCERIQSSCGKTSVSLGVIHHHIPRVLVFSFALEEPLPNEQPGKQLVHVILADSRHFAAARCRTLPAKGNSTVCRDSFFLREGCTEVLEAAMVSGKSTGNTLVRLLIETPKSQQLHAGSPVWWVRTIQPLIEGTG